MSALLEAEAQLKSMGMGHVSFKEGKLLFIEADCEPSAVIGYLCESFSPYTDVPK